MWNGGMWDVECGMWNVECEMLDVKCWMWNVRFGMGHAAREYFSHRCHSSESASLNRINGKGNAYYRHCPLCNEPYLFNFSPRCKALRVVA